MDRLKITELVNVVNGKVVLLDSAGKSVSKPKLISNYRKIIGLGIRNRFGAYFFDQFLILTFGIVLNVTVDSFGFFLSYFFTQFIYYFISEWLTQSTFGKMLFKGIVINEYGERLSLKQHFLRTISRLIPFEQFSFLTGELWHEKVSQSMVVSKNELKELIQLREKNIEGIQNGISLYDKNIVNKNLALERKNLSWYGLRKASKILISELWDGVSLSSLDNLDWDDLYPSERIKSISVDREYKENLGYNSLSIFYAYRLTIVFLFIFIYNNFFLSKPIVLYFIIIIAVLGIIRSFFQVPRYDLLLNSEGLVFQDSLNKGTRLDWDDVLFTEFESTKVRGGYRVNLLILTRSNQIYKVRCGGSGSALDLGLKIHAFRTEHALKKKSEFKDKA